MPSTSGSPASKECSFQCCLNPQLSISASVDHTRSNNNSSTFRYDFTTATASSLYPHIQYTNHESLPRLPESFRSFTRAFPQYLQTAEADHIRAQDYFHLSISNHICLDYAGCGLFSYAQEKGPDPMAYVASSSLTPPQPTSFSRVPSFEVSYRSTNLNLQTIDNGQESDFESQVRERIMRFLNISSEDYSLVFTANQSSAFKVLAESYPFKTNRSLLTVYDHDNDAVEAMIESSKRRGARPVSAEFKWPTLKIHSAKLKELIFCKKNKKSKRGLFVFPLQSRVTGARYSYQWMNMAQENDWHVLLDATALGPKAMDTLGLSLFQPDFLICTCYKVFGENPSGFGCLFIKRPTSSILIDSTTTPSTAIVNLVPPSAWSQNLSTANRDTNQTPNPGLRRDDQAASTSLSGELHQTGALTATGEFYQTGAGNSNASSSPQVQFKGLDNADALGLALISTRSRYLINWLINAMSSLKHPDSESGHPLISIYGPTVRFERAPALAFNVFDWKGERVNPILVQKIAGRNNISLGCGFVKNIWFGKRYEEEKERVLERRRRRTEEEASKKRKENVDCGISVVTITIGYLNNFQDVYGLWTFVSRFLDADSVEKERWRYAALNQRTVEV